MKSMQMDILSRENDILLGFKNKVYGFQTYF